MLLQIDIDRISESEPIRQVDVTANPAPECSLFVGKVDTPLLDSVRRLLKPLDTPDDVAAILDGIS